MSARTYGGQKQTFLFSALAPPVRAQGVGTPKIIIPFWDYTATGYIIQISMNKSVYSKDYKEIIERLKKARIEATLSQQDVANRLGKPQSYISKIESGERRLDVAEMKKFAEIYKQPFEYFLK